MNVKETAISRKRKNEICEAAKKCFLSKGFKGTTMEDVIKETGMSKGGVYRYYKSTSDMLYDFMLSGNDYRFDKVDEFVKNNPGMSKDELAVELVMAKMFAKNDYMSIYAMFLIESEKNERLRELRDVIESNMKNGFLEFAEKSGLEILSCFANDDFMKFMYAIFIAEELIDIRNLFLNESDLFRDIIFNYLQKHKPE